MTFINPAVDCLDCARHDARISANPNIVSNCDVDSVLVAGIARVRVNRMTRSINGNVGRDLNVVANFDFSHVKNNEVVVGEKPLSHFDVVAVVAVEGRLDVNPVARLSEDLFYKAVFLLYRFRRKIVVLVNFLFALKSFFRKPVHPRFVRKVCKHSFFVIHFVPS